MTAPEVSPSSDPLLGTMAGAVVAQQESPCIMRIGVVTAIVEGSQITVKISGSDVLINCSYLFGSYYPLLGDRVVVFKQDSQWFCVGQMSGTIESNNPLPNSSFEEGVIGGIPTGWSIVVGAVAGGVPSFLVASPGSTNVSGKQVADFGVDSVGAGNSDADVYSPIVPALPGSHWTAAYYWTRVLVNTAPPLFSTLSLYIQFLDTSGALVTEYLVNIISIFADVVGPNYRRFSLSAFPAGFVEAPAASTSARIRFNGTFQMPAASSFSFFIDNVILRQVD